MSTRRVVLGRLAALAGVVGAPGAGVLVACGQEPAVAPQTQATTGSIEILWPTEARSQAFVESDWLPTFKKDFPNIQVQLTVVGGGWPGLYEKIVISNASGQPPTIARGKEYFTGDLAYQGTLEPLDTWLKGQKDVAPEQYLPQIWGLGHWQSKTWALPLYTFVRPLYHNLALFREAGLIGKEGKPTAPNTWKEYAQYARQLTRPAAGQWGTQLIYGVPTDEAPASAWMCYLRQNGGDFINAENTKYTFNGAPGIEALQFVTDMIRDGSMRPPDTPEPGEGVRKIGMWNAVGNGIYNNYPKNLPDLQYGLALVPGNKNRGVVVRGQNLFLMKSHRAKDAGWTFMRWASRDANSHGFTVNAMSLGPVKTANFEKEPYANDAEWRVNLDQFRVKDNGFQPVYPGYTEGGLAVAEELFQAYIGKKTPKDALAEAERRATLLLKK